MTALDKPEVQAIAAKYPGRPGVERGQNHFSQMGILTPALAKISGT